FAAKKIDVNKDGMISRDEILARQQSRFDMLDINQDGQLEGFFCNESDASSYILSQCFVVETRDGVRYYQNTNLTVAQGATDPPLAFRYKGGVYLMHSGMYSPSFDHFINYVSIFRFNGTMYVTDQPVEEWI
ncbi:MAG: hypothetical protein ACPGTU_18790, partial [Myxococcota bacterium]